MSTPPRPSSVLQQLVGPIVDKNGVLTLAALLKFNEWEQKLNAAVTLSGQLQPNVSVVGDSIPLGVVTENFTPTGQFDSLDEVLDGTTFAKVKQTALTGNQVDLGKVGVVGQAGSAKILQNVMSNYSNNATVDSIDNGTNATIRVYGPGGPGTSWHQFIGSGTSSEIPAFAGTAAYGTDFNVYYDGSYHITPNGSDTLSDGVLFSGSLHTVNAGGAGGSNGGGGTGGGAGGGGGARK